MKRYSVMLLSLLLVSACEGAPQGGATLVSVTAASPQDPGVTPTPTGTPAPQLRSVFSAWSQADNAYAVDLSAGSFGAGWTTLYKFQPINQSYWCSTNVAVAGTETTGTLIISRALSVAGLENVNQSYCYPLVATYEYVRTLQGGLKLCRTDNHACSIWVTP